MLSAFQLSVIVLSVVAPNEANEEWNILSIFDEKEWMKLGTKS
jgi:hypothetical protein